MHKIPNRQKIEGGRAEYAYECVKKVQKETYAKDYKSYVKKLAPLIQTNGFGNTIAFVYSKSKPENNKDNAYKKIYNQLNNWLRDEKKLIDKDKDLMETIVQTDSKTYRQLTTESLALINWWRRFVDGMIEDKNE